MEHAIVEWNDEWTTSGVGRPTPPKRGFQEERLRLWAICGTSGFSAIASDLKNGLFMFLPGTSAGSFVASEPSVLQSAVAEIRRRSQLTWEQLARVFGVQRRSLHFWARGARPSAENAERILRVLAIVRHFDTGDAERTRTELLRPLQTGISIYEMLCANRDDEVVLLVRSGSSRTSPAPPARRARRPPALSASERYRRRGSAPTVLLDARHDAAPSRGRLPVPGVGGDAFADLDVIVTVEKSLLVRGDRTAGLPTETDQRRFGRGVGRVYSRFAFPDDLSLALAKLVERVRAKHDRDTDEGRALVALEEIRVTGTPSWSVDEVDVFLTFAPATRAEALAVLSEEDWDGVVDGWLRRADARGVVRSVDGAMVPLDELSAREYVDSDPLDIE
jgi:transcriptional regulator with XRE-family HTH domain